MFEEEKLPPFTGDTLIAEAEGRIAWEELERLYKALGIKCLNCPAAMVETFAEGAALHKFDLEVVLANLNDMEAKTPFNGFPLTFGQRIWRTLFGKKNGKPAD